MVLTFPDLKDCSLRAVELVGSRRPVGKRWETRSVFHGLSIGDRACAVRREPAQPAVHKSTVHSAFRLSRRQRLGFCQGTEIRLVRRLPTQRLMRSPAVVPVEALGQTLLLLDAAVAGAQIHPLVLHRPPQPSTKMLSWQRPRPSMLISILCFLSTSVNSALVNWLPWSVLKISGVP